MKILKLCLASALALLGLVSSAGAWTLDTEGTGPEAQPGYFCRSPFAFHGTTWNPQYRIFTIDVQGQCGVIQDPSKYLPGWGGGGTDWKIVDVYGVFHYENGETRETVRHEGQTILDTTLACNKNPWLYPFDVSCSVKPQPTPINNSGVAVNTPFPVSAPYLDSSLILALRQWETDKDKPDPLDGWDPMGTPDGYSALTVGSPTSYQSIPAAAPGFSLALNGIPPSSQAKVLMNWQVIVQGPEWSGDIHLSEEARWDWWQFDGPPFAMAGAFPLTVAVSPGFFAGKPGLYRLQVKLEGETWWSPWRYFWIGPPQENVPHSDQFQVSAAARQKLALKKKFTALDNQGAQRLMKTAGPAATQPAAGVAPKGAPVAQQSAPATLPVAIHATTPPAGSAKTVKVLPSQSLTALAPKAVVTVEPPVFKPAPPQIGKPLGVVLTFKNSGTATSDPALKYTVTCSVKSGGPNCPVAKATRQVNAAGIQPGKTASDTLAGASPAVAGSYELTVKIGEAKAVSFPFSVGSKAKLLPAPQKSMKKSAVPAR